jgi:hypothetical protein
MAAGAPSGDPGIGDIKLLCGRVEGVSYKRTEKRGRANSYTPDRHIEAPARPSSCTRLGTNVFIGGTC